MAVFSKCDINVHRYQGETWSRMQLAMVKSRRVSLFKHTFPIPFGVPTKKTLKDFTIASYICDILLRKSLLADRYTQFLEQTFPLYKYLSQESIKTLSNPCVRRQLLNEKC